MKKRTLVLAILDGWGIGSKDYSNAIHIAEPKNIDYIKRTYPAGTLQASGIAIGLPWKERGDSEVGHLTLGSGKTLYQHYPRISISIKDGTFAKNNAILETLNYVKKNKSNLNVIGLIGQNNIQSSLEHLEAVLELSKKEDISNINLHLFTDGKDSSPKSAKEILNTLPKENIATISGRYFAMDRDLHWDRTTKVYKVMTGISPQSEIRSIDDILDNSYKRGLTDEYIEPVLLNKDRIIKNGDGIIFFNFREDNMRQLAEMFINPDAGESHTIPQNLQITTFTNYGNKFNFKVAYPPEIVQNPLGKVLADHNKVQLRIAETAKYAHVTYFFNGFIEDPFKNEYRVLIPSKKIARPDGSPEMMAKEVTERALSAIDEGIYDFILINFANTDTIAHTGNIEATIEAIKVVDEQIGLLMKSVLATNNILVITSDHGNAEAMINIQTGEKETAHDTNPVPIYVITKGYERTKDDDIIKNIERSKIGALADVAPTILELMGIEKPKEMNGVSILQSLM